MCLAKFRILIPHFQSPTMIFRTQPLTYSHGRWNDGVRSLGWRILESRTYQSKSMRRNSYERQSRTEQENLAILLINTKLIFDKYQTLMFSCIQMRHHVSPHALHTSNMLCFQLFGAWDVTWTRNDMKWTFQRLKYNV
jgi:hypothetical protein